MNGSDFNAFLRATQQGIQAQSQQIAQLSAEVRSLRGQLAAVRYLAYALTHIHPNPDQLANAYMSLMDHTADALPPQGAAALRDDMNVVLKELLALRQRQTGSL